MGTAHFTVYWPHCIALHMLQCSSDGLYCQLTICTATVLLRLQCVLHYNALQCSLNVNCVVHCVALCCSFALGIAVRYAVPQFSAVLPHCQLGGALLAGGTLEGFTASVFLQSNDTCVKALCISGTE